MAKRRSKSAADAIAAAKRKEVPRAKVVDDAPYMLSDEPAPPRGPWRLEDEVTPAGQPAADPWKELVGATAGAAHPDAARGMPQAGVPEEAINRALGVGGGEKAALTGAYGFVEKTLGRAAAESPFIKRIVEAGERLPVDKASVTKMLESFGVTGEMLAAANVPISRVQKLIGRINGDIGKLNVANEAKAGERMSAYLGKITSAVGTITKAAGGDEAAMKALETGKLAGEARSWGRVAAEGAAGLVAGLAAQSAVSGIVDTLPGSTGDTRQALARSQQSVSFDDLVRQYEAQNAASKMQARMQVDFPNVMAAALGGGRPQAVPQQAPTHPNANPGDLVLPGGDPDDMPNPSNAMMGY